MLRLLVDFLSGIIRVLAAVCIIGGAFVGYLQAPILEVEPWAGALIGFAAGFLAASVGAGLIACFILIENHLRVLADAQASVIKSPAPMAEKPELEESALERAERVAAYTQKYRSQNYDVAAGADDNAPAKVPDETADDTPVKAGKTAKKSK